MRIGKGKEREAAPEQMRKKTVSVQRKMSSLTKFVRCDAPFKLILKARTSLVFRACFLFDKNTDIYYVKVCFNDMFYFLLPSKAKGRGRPNSEQTLYFEKKEENVDKHCSDKSYHYTIQHNNIHIYQGTLN